MKLTEENTNLSTSVSSTTAAGLKGYVFSPILEAVTRIPWLINKAM